MNFIATTLRSWQLGKTILWALAKINLLIKNYS
jgi:hypothetical protein